MILDTPLFQFCLVDTTDHTFLPQRGEPTASGYDLKASKDVIISAGETSLIPLGVKVFCPEGWWLELKPRSSTHLKKKLHCLNGVIDQDYENQIFLCATYLPGQEDPKSLFIPKGERIAQLIPRKREEMDLHLVTDEEFFNLSKKRNAIRNGGFGSTDKEVK